MWGRAVLLRDSIWGWKFRSTSPLLVWGLPVLPLGRPTSLVVLVSARSRGGLTTISFCGVLVVSKGNARKRSTLVQHPGDFSTILRVDACCHPFPVITRRVRTHVFLATEILQLCPNRNGCRSCRHILHCMFPAPPPLNRPAERLAIPDPTSHFGRPPQDSLGLNRFIFLPPGEARWQRMLLTTRAFFAPAQSNLLVILYLEMADPAQRHQAKRHYQRLRRKALCITLETKTGPKGPDKVVSVCESGLCMRERLVRASGFRTDHLLVVPTGVSKKRLSLRVN